MSVSLPDLPGFGASPPSMTPPRRERRAKRRARPASFDWGAQLAARHAERQDEARESQEVWDAEVKPWLRTEAEKIHAQPGVRLFDRKWQKLRSLESQEYSGSIRRLHQSRAQLTRDREAAKSLFARELHKSIQVSLGRLVEAMRARGFLFNQMSTSKRTHLLRELSAALEGKLTDSVEGRRKKLLDAAKEVSPAPQLPVTWALVEPSPA